jgi:histone H3/H4
VIYRLAHAGGVMRMQRSMVPVIQAEIEALLDDILTPALLYMTGCKRKTVMTTDVAKALKMKNRPVY